MLRLTFTRLKEIQIQPFCRYYRQILSSAVTMATPSEEAIPSEEATPNTKIVFKRKINKKGLSNSKSSNCRRSLHKDLKNHHESNSTGAIGIDEEKESKEWCCYLIISADMRKTSVGVTTNFKRRLRQHNGELHGGAKATRAGRPWKCVCLVHGFKDQDEACRFEWKWKHVSRNSSCKSKKFDNLSEQTGYFASPLVKCREVALNRVKVSLNCQHLKIQWQGQLSSQLL